VFVEGKEDEFELQGAVASTMDKGVKAATGAWSNVKAVADRAIDVAGAVTSAVNMDTPNDGSNAKPVEPRQGINMANMDNIRYAQILGPMAGEKPDVNPPFGTDIPETNILYLARRTTLYTTFRMQTTDVIGAELLRIPITPCPDLFQQTATGLFQPTMMEHVATPFEYWTGGINVTIQFAGSVLANARIGVASRFGIFGGSVTLPLFSSQYGTVFNVGEEDTLKFSVPYLASTKWKRVPIPDVLGNSRLNPLDFCTGRS